MSHYLTATCVKGMVKSVLGAWCFTPVHMVIFLTYFTRYFPYVLCKIKHMHTVKKIQECPLLLSSLRNEWLGYPEQIDGIILASYSVDVQMFSDYLPGKHHFTSVDPKLTYIAEWLGSSLLEVKLILTWVLQSRPNKWIIE